MSEAYKGNYLLSPSPIQISPEIRGKFEPKLKYKAGVHTIEVSTDYRIKYDFLPQLYRDAIDLIGRSRRYRICIPKLPAMGEYNSVNSTQEAINEVYLGALADAGSGRCVTTRIDFRLDDYEHTYSDNLPNMLIIVNLVAFICGLFERVSILSDRAGVITSVRAMPDKDDKIQKYGIEYYDKEHQKGTRKYGRARLEFRRLNLYNESVAFVVREWCSMLKSVTNKSYKEMLSVHAKLLLQRKKPDETALEFMRRIRPDVIAREEEGILFKLLECGRNHYYCGYLPRWRDVKACIEEITNHLDYALEDENSPKCGENKN